jgi:hypothetical protein
MNLWPARFHPGEQVRAVVSQVVVKLALDGGY